MASEIENVENVEVENVEVENVENEENVEVENVENKEKKENIDKMCSEYNELNFLRSFTYIIRDNLRVDMFTFVSDEKDVVTNNDGKIDTLLVNTEKFTKQLENYTKQIQILSDSIDSFDLYMQSIRAKIEELL